MKISERLKNLRINNNYTQKDIYKKLNMSQNGYASWEQGRTEPNIDAIFKLCEIYNISPNYLLGYENDDYTKNYTPSNTLELPADITEIIETYLTLNDRDKYLLRAYLNAMVISNEEYKDNLKKA